MYTCIVCGKEFEARWPGRKGNIVCSEECRRKRITQSKLKGTMIKCKHCGKDVWVKPSQLGKKKYCGTECARADKFPDKVEMTCLHCGKTYLKPPSIAITNKYCSQKCKQLHERDREVIKCDVCGKELERAVGWIRKAKEHACSPECNAILSVKRVFYSKNCDTKPELMFDEQTPEYINKTSSGKFFINFKNGRIKNPDFIVRPVNETKKVIEIFGRYWHKPEEEQELIELYKEAGYKCLVVWEDEVYNHTYTDKLNDFLNC